MENKCIIHHEPDCYYLDCVVMNKVKSDLEKYDEQLKEKQLWLKHLQIITHEVKKYISKEIFEDLEELRFYGNGHFKLKDFLGYGRIKKKYLGEKKNEKNMD